ncbi:sensor histidine kinase [Chitinophaga eiseniae]|uniref:histidine kinase n=1 Tax=Chitinophaga eiseniae TaxID=634771 RepID=A0A847SHU8_9BACT|nr:HAMP domain-containing sensor histidine kinase [Chitinophaga eiseniae]NLR82900.1 HAMP domain-containing histidine kinase [Chitinophaga eiseniae]
MQANLRPAGRTMPVSGYKRILLAEDAVRSFFIDFDPKEATATIWDATVAAISNPQSKYQENPQQRDFLMMTYRHLEKFIEAAHTLHGSSEELGYIAQQPEGLRDAEDFLALFAHEMRSQLTAINIACESMFGTMDTDKLEYYLSVIRATCHHVRKVLSNMIDTVVYRKGIAVPLINKSSFWVDRWLPEWVKPFELVAGVQNITFEYKINYWNKEAAICTDKEKIEQILCNLLTNAFHYAPSGSKILLTVSQSAEQLIILVKDEGSGVPVALAPLLFQPYKLTDKGKGGAGLGLYICKLYAELLGGTIQASTRANMGTTFTVNIPLSPPTP